MSASAPLQVAAERTVVLRPSKGWTSLGLLDVNRHRELLYFLVWRDVKIRYKQTALGAAWAIMQPLLTMLVFTVFFGGLARVGSDGLPYPLFSFAGLLPWTFFAQGLTQSATSLVGSATLIRKVYFPRLILPTAAVLACVVDFAIAFVVLVGLMGWYRVSPTLRVALVPALVLLAACASLGMGLWMATWNVKYRDVRYALPFFIQLGLFVTPVIYPASRVMSQLSARGLPGWLYGVNPMVGVVEGFRWSLLNSGSAPWGLLATGGVTTILILIGGAFYLRRMERSFADLV